MYIFSQFAIALVAIAHLYTLYIEMFAWETKGRKVFKDILPDYVFTPVKPLAANLGLYNGFLAAGLAWTFFIDDILWKSNVSLFFLILIIIAGLYGAITGPIKILFFQALPAFIAIVAVLIR